MIQEAGDVAVRRLGDGVGQLAQSLVDRDSPGLDEAVRVEHDRRAGSEHGGALSVSGPELGAERRCAPIQEGGRSLRRHDHRGKVAQVDVAGLHRIGVEH